MLAQHWLSLLRNCTSDKKSAPFFPSGFLLHFLANDTKKKIISGSLHAKRVFWITACSVCCKKKRIFLSLNQTQRPQSLILVISGWYLSETSSKKNVCLEMNSLPPWPCPSLGHVVLKVDSLSLKSGFVLTRLLELNLCWRKYTLIHDLWIITGLLPVQKNTLCFLW